MQLVVTPLCYNHQHPYGVYNEKFILYETILANTTIHLHYITISMVR